jgi:hypothetical protein
VLPESSAAAAAEGVCALVAEFERAETSGVFLGPAERAAAAAALGDKAAARLRAARRALSAGLAAAPAGLAGLSCELATVSASIEQLLQEAEPGGLKRELSLLESYRDQLSLQLQVI